MFNKTILTLSLCVLFSLNLGAQEEEPKKLTAAEMAAKLANPSAAVGQMSSNFDFTFFDGNLPGASDQFGLTYTFQPTIPFSFENGKSLFFRPAFPVLLKQPVYDGNSWENKTAFGEIAFDVAYGGTNDSGFMLVYGVVGTLPSSTGNDYGPGHWSFGPELLVGLVKDWGVFGNLTSYRTKVAGAPGKTNLISGQYFYAFPFGDGTTQIAAGPGWSYDLETTGNKLTLPLATGLAKTVVNKNGGVWKVGLEYWYYVANSDVFAPKHQIRLIITPVANLPWQ